MKNNKIIQITGEKHREKEREEHRSSRDYKSSSSRSRRHEEKSSRSGRDSDRYRERDSRDSRRDDKHRSSRSDRDRDYKSSRSGRSDRDRSSRHYSRDRRSRDRDDRKKDSREVVKSTSSGSLKRKSESSRDAKSGKNWVSILAVFATIFDVGICARDLTFCNFLTNIISTPRNAYLTTPKNDPNLNLPPSLER